MPARGFTLAELLIALALLGIIAAFTIPKVLQSSAENERVAKLRETVATLESAWQNVKADQNRSTLWINLDILAMEQLNTVRTTAAPVSNPGQELAGLPGHPCLTWGFMGYFQLHNGVVVAGTGPFAYDLAQPPMSIGNLQFCIDLNGKGAPNELGQDVLIAVFNPWGDFDGSAVDPTYTAGDNRKGYLWGSVAEPMRDTVGAAPAPPFDAPEAWAGYWLTR